MMKNIYGGAITLLFMGVMFVPNAHAETATLVVSKVVINDNGETATAGQFSFSVNGGTTTAFEADGSNSLTLDPGTYNVVEMNPSSSYTMTSSGCSDVVLASGETKTCTITNNDKATTTTPSTSVTAMIEKIKALLAQLMELQKQLATIRGDVKSLIRDGVAEGMTGDDIKQIQELLASDSSIYPEGKVTGFFGQLTKEALKRFQHRHGLNETGEVDSDTHDLLEEYLHEGYGGKIPPGLLGAPGIMKKVEMRFEQGCEDGHHGMGPLCKKLRFEQGTSTGTSTDWNRIKNDKPANWKEMMGHGSTSKDHKRMMDDENEDDATSTDDEEEDN